MFKASNEVCIIVEPGQMKKRDRIILAETFEFVTGFPEMSSVTETERASAIGSSKVISG